MRSGELRPPSSSSLEIYFRDSITGPNSPKQFHTILPTSAQSLTLIQKTKRAQWSRREQTCKLQYILIAVVSLKMSTSYPQQCCSRKQGSSGQLERRIIICTINKKVKTCFKTYNKPVSKGVLHVSDELDMGSVLQLCSGLPLARWPGTACFLPAEGRGFYRAMMVLVSGKIHRSSTLLMAGSFLVQSLMQMKIKWFLGQ